MFSFAVRSAERRLLTILGGYRGHPILHHFVYTTFSGYCRYNNWGKFPWCSSGFDSLLMDLGGDIDHKIYYLELDT